MDLGIKNDDALVKVATILQRIFQNEGKVGEDFSISDEEKVIVDNAFCVNEIIIPAAL